MPPTVVTITLGIFNAISCAKKPLKPEVTMFEVNVKKTFALFLPANELHEIGLLYLAYVLKERGDRVIYLGQSLPKEYLTDLLDNQDIDALVSVFTTNPDSEYIPEYLEDLTGIIDKRNIKVHLTGYQFASAQINNVHDNVLIYSTLKDLSDHI